MEVSIEDTSEDELAFICDHFQPPYAEHVSTDPKIEELREVVCRLRLRPAHSARWDRFGPMHAYNSVMSECWYENARSRLSALRIRKTLGEIAIFYYNVSANQDI